MRAARGGRFAARARARNPQPPPAAPLLLQVDLLQIIQLGVTCADEAGELADDCPTWQFNFKFNLQEDMYAQDSIDLLTRSGIEFKQHEERGIDVDYFGEVFMTSGLVLNDDIKWISFHSGYDFGYLLKLLTVAPLPRALASEERAAADRSNKYCVCPRFFAPAPPAPAADEPAFFDLLKTYFPVIYDVKYLMSSIDNLKGGLNKLADDLKVERVGPMHQAGSDSLLSSATFFEMRAVYFDGKLDEAKLSGILFGLGGTSAFPASG